MYLVLTYTYGTINYKKKSVLSHTVQQCTKDPWAVLEYLSHQNTNCDTTEKISSLWYNPSFKFPLRHEWLIKGITMLSDLLTRTRVVLEREEFEAMYNVKVNFIDYHHIKVTITSYNLFWKETIDFFEPHPKNSALNILSNMDKKGCSKMYKLLKGSNTHILDNIVSSWNKNTVRNICNHDLSTLFNLHQATYTDTYLKYIQLRTLHKSFYTNVKLYKMGIKTSALCTFCNTANGSVEHMFIECNRIKDLWGEVRSWIIEIGCQTIS